MDKIKEQYKTIGAKTIMENKYPDMNFIIKELLPAKGLILFAGAPKIGKSWFVLQMQLSIAYGKSSFIGHEIVTPCKCLYLSLEDSESRIQSRIKKQGVIPDDNKLLFAFKWESNEKGVKCIRSFLDSNKDVKVICIDTKGKFSEGREDESFQSDYSWMSELKRIADDMNVAIVLITHLRKKKPDEDPYESISGTTANMAAADTTIMLKRLRNQQKGTLMLTSRDFAETEEDIFFDSNSCTWNIPSGSQMNLPNNMTPERQKIIDAIQNIGHECSPKEIVSIIGGTGKNISNMLSSMLNYDFVRKGSKRGSWILPEWDNSSTL